MTSLKITEHKPIYVTGVETEVIEFNDTAELLAVYFVQSHSKQPSFFRYSILKSEGQIRIPIIAEYDNGDKWLVIGFVEGDVSNIDLPEWKPAVRKT